MIAGEQIFGPAAVVVPRHTAGLGLPTRETVLRG